MRRARAREREDGYVGEIEFIRVGPQRAVRDVERLEKVSPAEGLAQCRQHLGERRFGTIHRAQCITALAGGRRSPCVLVRA